MAPHPWVVQAAGGVRFAVGLTGARGRTHDGGFLPHERPMPLMVAAGRRAEGLGFDGVFVGESPTTLPAPFVCLAALASTTARIRLGTLVTVPAFRHPIQLARIVADLDHLSGGRLVLGLGLGMAAADFAWLGQPFLAVPRRQAALAEAIEVITGIWGRVPFSYQGRHYRLGEVRGIPPPAEYPHPPIVIAGGGKNTLRQVARYADACNLGGPPGEVRSGLAVLAGHCADLGRPYEEVLRTHIAYVLLAPSEREVQAKLRGVAPEGTDFIEARVASGHFVAGTPARAAAYYQGLADAGVQYFVAAPADTADHETLHLLAHDVLPQIR